MSRRRLCRAGGSTPRFRPTALDNFRGFAAILVVRFGVKSALSASQGHGGFHFAKFADLILMISFGFAMLTYCSTPIPWMGNSFRDHITKEGLNISNQIEPDQTQQIVPLSPMKNRSWVRMT